MLPTSQYSDIGLFSICSSPINGMVPCDDSIIDTPVFMQEDDMKNPRASYAGFEPCTKAMRLSLSYDHSYFFPGPGRTFTMFGHIQEKCSHL